MTTETKPVKLRAPRSDRGTKRPNPAADLARVLTYCRVSVQVLETLLDDEDTTRDAIAQAKIAAFKQVLKEAGEIL